MNRVYQPNYSKTESTTPRVNSKRIMVGRSVYNKETIENSKSNYYPRAESYGQNYKYSEHKVNSLTSKALNIHRYLKNQIGTESVSPKESYKKVTFKNYTLNETFFKSIIRHSHRKSTSNSVNYSKAIKSKSKVTTPARSPSFKKVCTLNKPSFVAIYNNPTSILSTIQKNSDNTESLTQKVF